MVTFFVSDAQTVKPIQHATISNQIKAISQTDVLGFATFFIDSNLNFKISAVGYFEKTLEKNSFPATDTVVISLIHVETPLEEVVIVSTRSRQPIEQAPIKIEVLDAEEMQEESTVKPSTILGIVGDASGVQVQQSNAISGNVNIRIQGLEGKYTQVLRDGLPLYEGFSGGFGLTSIPPLDLKQVELIKGSASTLYGGGAIGGLINLISKTPTHQRETVVTINQTSLNETNINAFASKKNNKIGFTCYAGYTCAAAKDVNADGFSDVPKLQSVVLHPKVFFYPGNGTTLAAGFTSTMEKRNGGDMYVLTDKANATHQYFEKNTLLRNSGELSIEKKFSNRNLINIKASVSDFNRTINTSQHTFKGNQLDYFTEASLYLHQNNGSWVSGVNLAGNTFKVKLGDPVLLHDIKNSTLGFFSQYTISLHGWTAEAGLRTDVHNRYGTFVLPRLAAFYKINAHWGARLGWGMGYKIPDALSPQIKDYDIENILPIGEGTKAERSSGYNVEVNYKHKWSEEGSVFINHAFFLTQLDQPLVAAENTMGQLMFFNAINPIVTKGFDTYIKLRLEDWEIYAGLTYTIAERRYLDKNNFMPLTPKWRSAAMLTYEIEGKARLCVESSYNGPQYRYDATQTPGYLFMASMADVKVNRYCNLILNCENLFDYRQSRVEPLFTGSITKPSFTPLWAPIDGRVVNLCLRVKL